MIVNFGSAKLEYKRLHNSWNKDEQDAQD